DVCESMRGMPAADAADAAEAPARGAKTAIRSESRLAHRGVKPARRLAGTTTRAGPTIGMTARSVLEWRWTPPRPRPRSVNRSNSAPLQGSDIARGGNDKIVWNDFGRREASARRARRRDGAEHKGQSARPVRRDGAARGLRHRAGGAHAGGRAGRPGQLPH